MKKKLAVLSMLLICILAITGCGKKEDAVSVLTKAQENSKKIESTTSTGTMKMKMSAGEETVDMTTTMDMTIFTKPYKAKIKMSMDMGGMGKQDSDIYLVVEKDNYVTYTNIGGAWYKSNMDKKLFEQAIKGYDTSAYTDALLKCKDTLQLSEVEEDGKKCYKVEGSISGEAMKQMIESTGLKNQLASTGADISVYDNLGDLKLVSFVEKDSYQIYKVSLNMKDMVNKVMENLSKSASGDTPAVKFDACTMDLKYTGYNNAKGFELPEEAKDAQELQQ